MSLTYQQSQNSRIWRILTDVIDPERVKSFVYQVNTMAIGKKRLGIQAYPEGFNYPLLGKSVVYAFYYKFYPGECLRDSIAGRYLQQQNSLSRVLKFCKDDPCLLAIALAMAEDMARKGKSPTKGMLEGCLNLPGKMSPIYRAVYDDLSLISQSFGVIHQAGKSAQFNVTFANSSKIGGADAQALIDGELLTTITTLKRSPLTTDKVYQQLAYYLLDYCYPSLPNSLGRTHSNIRFLSFHLSRTMQIVQTNPSDYLFPRDHKSWENWCEIFGLPASVDDEYKFHHPHDDLFRDPDFMSSSPWEQAGGYYP